MGAAMEHGTRKLVAAQEKALKLQDTTANAKVGTRGALKHDSELHILRLRGWGKCKIYLAQSETGWVDTRLKVAFFK